MSDAGRDPLRSHESFRHRPKPIEHLHVTYKEVRAKMAEDENQAERDQELMRYRILEREVTDPLAAGLLRDIVSEMEACLADSGES